MPHLNAVGWFKFVNVVHSTFAVSSVNKKPAARLWDFYRLGFPLIWCIQPTRCFSNLTNFMRYLCHHVWLVEVSKFSCKFLASPGLLFWDLRLDILNYFPGTVEKGVVEVTNCFCVPHKEYEETVRIYFFVKSYFVWIIYGYFIFIILFSNRLKLKLCMPRKCLSSISVSTLKRTLWDGGQRVMRWRPIHLPFTTSIPESVPTQFI